MFETTSKPYLAWQDYGKMVNAARPRGLVVVSAHWEDERGTDKVSGQSDSRDVISRY
jgi:aromatic ring-opening dioxygenase catalytic subunit (LigB family)